MTIDNGPTITRDTADAIVETKDAPRVTAETIRAKIDDVNYVHIDVMTIAVITMKNGFKVTGQAAPASPANFDAQVGERYAYEDAVRKLWQLEGYLLCEQLRPTTV